MEALERTYSKYLNENISKDNMYNTIATLAHSDNARVGGCIGEYTSAKYIKDEFEKLNLTADLEPFPINRPVSIGKGYLNIGGKKLLIKSFNGGTDIPKYFSGQLVYIGLGTQKEISELGDLKDKIVLIKRGENSFQEKCNIAQEAGVKGILMFNNSTGIATGSLGNNPPTIPILGMCEKDGEELLEIISSNEDVTLTNDNFEIYIEYYKTSTSFNVIGTLYAENNDENTKTIILGAHYDSASSPGASDNASGVSVVLEVARVLSTPEIKKSFKHNVQFMAIGSEELGLLGSQAYAEKIKETNTVESFKSMINLDMVGVGDVINVFTANIELSQEINDLAVKHIKNGQGTFGGNYTPMTNSDHGPFEAIGIPSCLVQTGPDHHFHTENDTIEKIDVNNLYNVALVIAGMILDMQEI